MRRRKGKHEFFQARDVSLRGRSLLFHGAGSAKSKGDKAGDTETTSASGDAVVGKAFIVGDAEWTILEVTDHGKTMKPTDGFTSKNATTAGRFIQARFKVTNKGKTEGSMMGAPKIVDDKSASSVASMTSRIDRRKRMRSSSIRSSLR